MHSFFGKAALALAAMAAAVSAQGNRTQEGLCGDNGLDGITGTVPACSFEAGTTYNGEGIPYQLPITGVTSCDQCTEGSIYGLYLCHLYDCAEDDPYEPCGYATC